MEFSVLGHKMRVEIILLSMILGAFIGINMFCSCAGGVKEGFKVSADLVGAALSYSMGDGVKSSWEKSDVEATSIYHHLEGNAAGSVPLDKNKLFMFEKNEFKPDCCPSAYSSSTGCLCASPEQMKYLNQRGGNRTLSTTF